MDKYKAIEKINDFFIKKCHLSRCIPICVKQNTPTNTFGCKYSYSYGTFFFVDYMEKIK